MIPSRSLIEQIYLEHPLRKDTILARVRRDGVSLDALTERVLSTDPRTEITDQNHIGGRIASESLARACAVSKTTRIADLGCGLGGTARVLAEKYGCRVDGYDLSGQRVRDARSLTRLVGLSRLVSFTRADMLRVRVPPRKYDIVLAQGSFVHIADKCRLISRWAASLRAGGRLAIEDACVRRLPATRAERSMLGRLEDDWAATLVHASTFADLCRGSELVVTTLEQLPEALPSYYRNLLSRDAADVPPRERRSWRDAVAAHDSGLIGLFRIIARNSDG